MLPSKSKGMYEAEYKRSLKWKRNKSLKIVNNDVILVYLSELSKQIKIMVEIFNDEKLLKL